MDRASICIRRALPKLLLAAAGLAASLAVAEERAAPLPADIAACAQVRIDAERLACYDKAVAPQVRGAAESPQASDSAASAAVASASRNVAKVDDRGNFLDAFWELSQERKRGTFNFLGFRPNYFLPAHYTTKLNKHPTSPAPGHSGQLPDYSSVEAKLQISLRTKLLENVGFPGGDLWFAYTQQSLWQLYSADISRPFRSTDHQPELLYVVPAPLDLPLGWKVKMAGLGLAHQSNGQSDPFSRNWNRWYVLGGLENGELAVTGRYNVRIHENPAQDDNPDIASYLGRTELAAIWSPGAYVFGATWKTNFDSRGSIQLDATVPVSRKDPKGLRWYVQIFSGYGETMIDYNFRQTSIGAGVALLGW